MPHRKPSAPIATVAAAVDRLTRFSRTYGVRVTPDEDGNGRHFAVQRFGRRVSVGLVAANPESQSTWTFHSPGADPASWPIGQEPAVLARASDTLDDLARRSCPRAARPH
ncbi:hypothetical protein ACFPZ0_00550 [Streptomonospora nanhaiensis]|uniref:hypothetical protein n=1 Tax=Streptomonospora nanhaiensis TaxID=1323731 RepID=UPI001C9906F9|nr:hypothetical protein [Streptomonospora nanhaiensis]MBX9386950.1 hypothetical protein [Streptomonospora nanhaiensis]